MNCMQMFILLLQKHVKRGDTIKSYSERVVKESCIDYMKTIQTLLFSYNDWNTNNHLLVINYKSKWITYPYIKELFLISLLIHNYKIKYKKKIRE